MAIKTARSHVLWQMEKERKERPGEEGDHGVQGRETQTDRVRKGRDREMQTDTERDTETLNS